MDSLIEGALVTILGITILLFAIKYFLSNFGKEAKKIGMEIFKIGITSEIVVFLFLISPIYLSIIAILFVIIGIFVHYKKKKGSGNNNNP